MSLQFIASLLPKYIRWISLNNVSRLSTCPHWVNNLKIISYIYFFAMPTVLTFIIKINLNFKNQCGETIIWPVLFTKLLLNNNNGFIYKILIFCFFSVEIMKDLIWLIFVILNYLFWKSVCDWNFLINTYLLNVSTKFNQRNFIWLSFYLLLTSNHQLGVAAKCLLLV